MEKYLDDNRRVGLFGFDGSIRKRLMEEMGNAVVVINCQVKKATTIMIMR